MKHLHPEFGRSSIIVGGEALQEAVGEKEIRTDVGLGIDKDMLPTNISNGPDSHNVNMCKHPEFVHCYQVVTTLKISI
jgi:hypothetical protein